VLDSWSKCFSLLLQLAYNFVKFIHELLITDFNSTNQVTHVYAQRQQYRCECTVYTLTEKSTNKI